METIEIERQSVDDHELPRFTVLGLFEDAIDAEQALMALRREERPAEQVSILVRDRTVDSGAGPERHGEVARAVVANALSAVSGWLLGLAALIVPENGTYLVAGPIGAALAGVRTIEAHNRQRAREETGGESSESNGVSHGGLRHTLTEFGFRLDEAAYLQNRLAAGSVLVAITTSDTNELLATRRLFADSSAVYIGQARKRDRSSPTKRRNFWPLRPKTPPAVTWWSPMRWRRCAASAERILAAFPSCWCADGTSLTASTKRSAKSKTSWRMGSSSSAQAPTIRYVVVGFGGLLGLGRHRIAVPSEQVDLRSDPIRLSLSKEILRRAPAYDSDMPFSRREEMAVNAYFGTTPYWLK